MNWWRDLSGDPAASAAPTQPCVSACNSVALGPPPPRLNSAPRGRVWASTVRAGYCLDDLVLFPFIYLLILHSSVPVTNNCTCSPLGKLENTRQCDLDKMLAFLKVRLVLRVVFFLSGAVFSKSHRRFRQPLDTELYTSPQLYRASISSCIWDDVSL